MDYDKLLRKYRKKPILDIHEYPDSVTKINYGQDIIKKLVPHREPFLLVDKLTGLDLSEDNECIIGSRTIVGSDPVFQGHFPDYPVYPGALQMEMGGQLGLCLTYFMLNKTYIVPEKAQIYPVRATKVLGALFLEPLLPDSEAVLIAKKLEYDGFFGTVFSQVIANNVVCCVSIAQVIFLDQTG